MRAAPSPGAKLGARRDGRRRAAPGGQGRRVAAAGKRAVAPDAHRRGARLLDDGRAASLAGVGRPGVTRYWKPIHPWSTWRVRWSSTPRTPSTWRTPSLVNLVAQVEADGTGRRTPGGAPRPACSRPSSPQGPACATSSFSMRAATGWRLRCGPRAATTPTAVISAATVHDPDRGMHIGSLDPQPLERANGASPCRAAGSTPTGASPAWCWR